MRGKKERGREERERQLILYVNVKQLVMLKL